MTMDQSDSRIGELFAQARVLEPNEQNDFLNKNCTVEEIQIRQEVERLLEAHRSAPRGEFKNPILPKASSEQFFNTDLVDPYLGQKLGPYQLKKRIASGGFGVIYLAIREEQFHQKVAVKILRPEQQQREQVLRRFELEQQLLADLEHEYIAHMITGGETAAGDPYFVMEYVEGKPITDYCDENKLSVDQRLELFEKVCAAVMHAHQFGVIHRDLKPSNILVTAAGTPKLLDFGIAKLFDPILRKRMLSITQTEGAIPMTPLYASPEQLLSQRISTATDVYSLGVLLYEMLCGRNPHTSTSASTNDVRKAICEDAPTPPSTALSQTPKRDIDEGSSEISSPEEIGRRRRLDPRRLRKHLSGDLDNIVLMALRKEPERRYANATELRVDIQRFRRGEPVRARKNAPLYAAKRLMRRHFVATAATVAVLLSLVGGSAIATLGWRNARAANARAEEAARHWKLQLAIRQWERGEFANLAETLEADFGVSSVLSSTWEQRYLRNLISDLPESLDVGKQITGMDFHEPTGRMCLAHYDGTVSIWRRDPKWEKETDWKAHSCEVLDVAWRPSGEMIATAGRDETIMLWKDDGAALVAKTALPISVNYTDTSWQDTFLNYRCIAWSPQGDRLAIPTDSAVALFEGDTLERISDDKIPCLFATAATWSPDGERLAFGGLTTGTNEASLLRVKNFKTGEISQVTVPGLTVSLDWIEGEERVAVGITTYPGLKGLVGVCDYPEGKFRANSLASNEWTDVVWAGDEVGLVYGGSDGFIRRTSLGSNSDGDKWQLHRGPIEKSHLGFATISDCHGRCQRCRSVDQARSALTTACH